MGSARNFHPEWGYLAPAPSFMRTARVVMVATAIGATAGAVTVLSLVERPEADASVSVSARTLEPATGSARVILARPRSGPPDAHAAQIQPASGSAAANQAAGSATDGSAPKSTAGDPSASPEHPVPAQMAVAAISAPADSDGVAAGHAPSATPASESKAGEIAAPVAEAPAVAEHPAQSHRAVVRPAPTQKKAVKKHRTPSRYAWRSDGMGYSGYGQFNGYSGYYRDGGWGGFFSEGGFAGR